MLSAQRGAPDFSVQNWERYQAYLRSVRDRFPANAYQIATSEWWYSFDAPAAPHDGRLVNLTISDKWAESESEERFCSIAIDLQSAYSGRILLRYPKVERYQLTMPGYNASGIHGDWRFDEFSLSEDGFLVHTIEWADGPDWVITATELFHEHSSDEGGSESGNVLHTGMHRRHVG